MKVPVDSTNASGTASSWGYTTMFDGRPFPVTGRNGTDSPIVRVVTAKINEIVSKQGDRVVQMLLNVLSADNQTIQVTYYSTNAQGQTNVTSATYERMQYAAASGRRLDGERARELGGGPEPPRRIRIQRAREYRLQARIVRAP